MTFSDNRGARLPTIATFEIITNLPSQTISSDHLVFLYGDRFSFSIGTVGIFSFPKGIFVLGCSLDGSLTSNCFPFGDSISGCSIFISFFLIISVPYRSER
jgi:hypothetical protein